VRRDASWRYDHLPGALYSGVDINEGDHCLHPDEIIFGPKGSTSSEETAFLLSLFDRGDIAQPFVVDPARPSRVDHVCPTTSAAGRSADR
jgi:hypothetical protein